ncbi:hypothetical protein [Rufibacter sp. LB8]|uniref:hypothetical protein n=1 Tax=Rufibacter sp. LB8 TaxID=2777781 RepID=UPI001CEF92B3|nr:hypothetical protein [Rufibacter sp. LB8]
MNSAMRQGVTSSVFGKYQAPSQFLDEVFQPTGEIKPEYQGIYEQFLQFSKDDFRELNEHAKMSFFNQGITFSVYNYKAKGVERIFPYDLFPRVIQAAEWARLEEGIL